MTHEKIINYCLSKAGAYLDYPFGHDVTVIKVKKRIFTQLFLLKGMPMATFNCDMMTGELYRSLYPDTVTRGYHCPPIQQPYFNTVILNKTVPDDEILNMIDHSYTVVKGKLPKYVQKQLTEGLYEA